MKHIQQVAHTHLLQNLCIKKRTSDGTSSFRHIFFKFLMNILWSIVTLSSICRASSDYSCSRCLSLVFEFGSIKGRSRKKLRPEIFQARTPVEDLTMFEDQQAIAICFFWLTRKRWGEQQEFSRWKKSYTRSSRKGWLEKMSCFFSKPLHLFLWKLWINVGAARCVAFQIW